MKVKGNVINISEVVMDDFSTKFRVDILFDDRPGVKLGDATIIQEEK